MPSHEDHERIGVIGLGLMGPALAERLLEHGFRVTVWNRSREKSVPQDNGAIIEVLRKSGKPAAP